MPIACNGTSPVFKSSPPAVTVAKASATRAAFGWHELGAAAPAVGLIGARRAVEGCLTAVIAIAIAEATPPPPEATLIAPVSIVMIAESACNASNKSIL